MIFRGSDRLAERLDRLDDQAVVFLADLVRVVVEQGDDVEAAGPEPAVPQQGPAQVAQADQGQRPVVVDPEDVPQRVDQLFDPVADARMAELPKNARSLRTWAFLIESGSPSWLLETVCMPCR